MEIPIPYQIILKRFYDTSFAGKIGCKIAKRILTFYCRIPKNMIVPIINEMRDNNWIKNDGRDYFQVLKKVDCTILYRHPGQKEYNGTIF